MKKILSVTLAVILLLSVFSVSFSVFAAANGFVRENGAVYYYENGEKQYSRWVSWNDNLYYLDYDGKVVANDIYWVYKTESYYCFNSKGVMQKGGFVKLSRTYNYNDGTSYTYTDVFYARSNGRLVQGWQTIGGKKYYFSPYMYKDGVNNIDDYDYLFDANGVLLAGGLQKVKYSYSNYSWTDHYYTNKYGIVYTGWKKINNKWYYFKPEMVKGTGHKIDGKVYVFNKNGTRINSTGWVKIASTGTKKDGSSYTYYDYFYLNKGIAKTGWQKINGKTYYFSKDTGEMARNGGYKVMDTSIKKAYVFEANGALSTRTGWIALKSDSGDYTYKFYVTKGGVAKTGFKQWKGNYYYFDEYGYMATGVTTLYNEDDSPKATYYFNSKGVWIKDKAGWVKETYSDGGVVYYYFVKGVAKTGWKVINGNSYCFDEYGQMYRNGTYYINGKNYTFRANGTLVK